MVIYASRGWGKKDRGGGSSEEYYQTNFEKSDITDDVIVMPRLVGDVTWKFSWRQHNGERR